MAVRQSEARIRQIAFWKKHQSILQNCADLSKMCDMKILVMTFYVVQSTSKTNKIFHPLQCIMTLPDKVADGVQQEFQWDDTDGCDSSPNTTPPRRQGVEKTIHAHFIHGTTIVFDSFSDEQEVQRRNLAAINISKINDMHRRFDTDFTVRASGKVAAVLNASTVVDYRVVDAKRGHRSQAPTPMPSFSSIISNGATMAQSDRDLASSLAACASSSPHTTPVPQSIPFNQQNSTQDNDARIDQLRKRCRTMLQQQYPHRYPAEEAADSMVNHKTDYVSCVQQPIDHFHHTPGVTMTFCTATATPPRPFFAPVLRPVAVQQALSQIKFKHHAGGMDNDGQPVNCSSGVVAAGGGQCDDAAFTGSTANDSRQAFDGMGNKPHLSHPTTTATTGTSQSLPSLSLPKLCPASSADVMMQQSAFSVFIGGGGKPVILPPLPAAAPTDGHRLSSSDLILTTMACPVPVNGLMNLSDIRFHRSSDEIVTLMAAW